MNILWLSHFVPFPAKGGPLIRSYNLLKSVSNEHKVHLMCLVQPRLIRAYYPSIQTGLDDARKHFNEQLGIEEISFFELPSEKSIAHRTWCILWSLLKHRSYSVDWLESKSYRAHAAKVIANNSFQAVHVDTMGLTGMLPKNSSKIPIIINHHNAEHHMMYRRATKQKNIIAKIIFFLEARKIEKFDRDSISTATANIVCSQADKIRIAELSDADIPIHVIPNGVPYRRETTRAPEKGKLLFVGGLDWYPNNSAITQFLSEVWPQLRDSVPNLELDIIGKNPSNQIIGLVESFPEVHLHGYVDDLEKFYTQAMVFICPISDGGGTKLKVLDAMNHGVPVLGTELAFEGIDVVNGINALIVKEKSDYGKLLSSLIDSEETLSGLCFQSRQLIRERYDAVQIGEDYSKLLSGLCVEQKDL